MTTQFKDYRTLLGEYFDDSEIKFKPMVLTKDKKSALPAVYVDSRAVQERLDEVFGPDGWESHFETLSVVGDSKSVKCRLRCFFVTENHPNGQWVEREDVGSQSEQQDSDDKTKSAVSDSLKRTAVQFGIGRYLYSAKLNWHPYDEQKRRFVQDPVMPDRFRKTRQASANGVQTPPQQQPSQPPANKPQEARKPPQNDPAPAQTKQEVKSGPELKKVLDDNENGFPGLTQCVFDMIFWWKLPEDWSKWHPNDLAEARKCAKQYCQRLSNRTDMRSDDQSDRLDKALSDIHGDNEDARVELLRDILTRLGIHTIMYCSAEEMEKVIKEVVDSKVYSNS